MTAFSNLQIRIQGCMSDSELVRLSPSLTVKVALEIDAEQIGLIIHDGRVEIAPTEDAQVRISASSAAWESVLKLPPPPTYQSFTALQIANDQFDVSGDSQLIAQARPALERLFELITLSPPAVAEPVERSLAEVLGHYGRISSQGLAYDVYYETAGTGIPVLFLHTAGADGRQYQEQMSDLGLGKQYQMYALDLPFHGKSSPPKNWDGGSYRLTSAQYRDWCVAFIEQVIGQPAIIVGGSMGAAMALVLAAEAPQVVAGVVALEPPFQSRGRRNPFQNHVSVHGGLHNGAYVRGLMSPTSPVADRRRASWIYSQGGPGVYPGDLAFYSDEFDGAITAAAIDTAKTPVALLSGTYDYSATPADGAKLAALLAEHLHIVMSGLGHFPMIEHPDHFRPFLVQGLNYVTRS